MAVTGWWNTSYSIRRPLIVENVSSSPITNGKYFFAVLDVVDLIAQNKVRPDCQDLEVALYSEEAATPGWIYMERDLFLNGDGTVSIAFVAPSDFASSDQFYLYYCNSNLYNMPDNRYADGVFFDSLGNVDGIYEVVSTDANGIMLTRPTEDWKDGASTVINARAAFPFYGTYAKLQFTTSSSGGILEVLSATGALPIYLDTYGDGSIYEYKIEYDKLDRHIVRMRVTGSKNPSSSDWVVKLPDIAHPYYVKAEIGSDEEIYSGLISFRTTVGS